MRPTVNHILADHVSLELRSIDRLYINGYVPMLQTGGQVFSFLHQHLGFTIPSPAVLGRLGERYRTEVKRFIEANDIPLIRFHSGQRKDDVAKEVRRARPIDTGIDFLGVAQEKSKSFKGHKRPTPTGSVTFDFSRQWVFVNQLYFYLQDPEWGPAFIKIGTYIPYPVKICLNGHEWLKQQLGREGIAFESLDNGFLSCANPRRLQQLADQLGPDHIQDFFRRWSAVLPWPLTPQDRQAGYDHRLSLWQLECSATHVFDRPVEGRHFFDGVIRANLDLGRPDRVRLLFPGRHTSRTVPPVYGYRTRVVTLGVDPSLHVEYKHSHVKQYFKEGRALRTETTINNPADFGVRKGLPNVWKLKAVGQTVNQRLLETERIADDATLDPDEFDALQRPTICEGQRVSALRFADPRVMALFQVLCLYALQVGGFRSRDLRPLLERLLTTPYTANQMTYDLRRLRRRGLIVRTPHTHHYFVTPLGLRFAYTLTKIHQRLLKPAWATLLPAPTAPPQAVAALRVIDQCLRELQAHASLPDAA